MKSKQAEIMGKVFAAASIAAMAPVVMATHQGASKIAVHAADGSATTSRSLADHFAGIYPPIEPSWS